MDLRLAIGALFTIFGAILTCFGAFSNKAVYTVSLGIDVNLGWGVIMLVFGLAMATAGLKAQRRP